MDYVGLLTSRKTAGLSALRASLVNEAGASMMKIEKAVKTA
jgi:hypothetical protein